MKNLLILSLIIVLAGVGYFVFREPANSQAIKIGAVLPLTGPIALSGGEQCGLGIRLATEDINNAGGIKGRLLDLKIEDSRSNNADGVTAFTNVINNHTPVLMFLIGSALSKSIAPIATDNKIPVMLSVTVAPGATNLSPYIFRYYPTAIEEINALLPLIEKRGIKKFAVLHLDDEYGLSFRDKLKEEFPGEVVSESFVLNSKDFRTLLLKLKATNPDALLVVGFDSHTVTGIRQAQELGFEAQMFASSLAANPLTRKQLGELGVTVYAPASELYFGTPNLKLAALEQRFAAEKTSLIFDHYFVSCYDAVKLAAKALEQGADTPELVTTNLNELQGFESLLGPVTKTNREFAYPLYPAEVSRGTVTRQ